VTQTHPTTTSSTALVSGWLANHGDALWRFAVSRVGDQAAEDIVQETLLAAIKAAASFEGRSSAETWLLGIMNNKVMDYFRKRAREQAHREQELDTEQAAEFAPDGHWAVTPGNWDAAAEDPLRAAYRACMEKLPAILRDALELRELRNLPPETVCQALGITATNLWTRLHRARAALRKCIDDRIDPKRKERKQ
jgi:RNA polymerase sigma-70 factor (ECF subfamily)